MQQIQKATGGRRNIWSRENIIYLAVWGLLFAAPLLSLYVRTVSDANVVFDWKEVFIVWKEFAVFIALFLLHNFLLAPLLVYGHKRVAYFSMVAVILVAFTVYQCNNRPERHHPRPVPMREDGRLPHGRIDERKKPEGKELPPRPPHMERRRGEMPPPIVGEHDILSIVVLMLMFGANLGIKGYFRSRDDRKRLAALEKRSLEQQLEYLRYQINPHFFMNTLNNIHALVDIDPEKAKDTILELSKMMRFVLYEGNKQGVPLTRELDFIRHYVTLMQLRYTDKVHISVNLPQEVPDRQIPPLILITFIENAFKHGISYQRESFIAVSVAVEGGTLRFLCQNSKGQGAELKGQGAELKGQGARSEVQEGGVGLDNVRKRLDLLYDNDYILRIDDAEDVYMVELIIPLKV